VSLLPPPGARAHPQAADRRCPTRPARHQARPHLRGGCRHRTASAAPRSRHRGPGLTKYRLAEGIGVPAQRVGDIVGGKSPLTAGRHRTWAVPLPRPQPAAGSDEAAVVVPRLRCGRCVRRSCAEGSRKVSCARNRIVARS
jgi:hypothetical protein